jgi:hypothetical protein
MFEGGSRMDLTKSVDDAIVMEGELEMHLDEGSTNNTAPTRFDPIEPIAFVPAYFDNVRRYRCSAWDES